MRIASFGTDSEFFVTDKKTGTLVPAYRFLKGTKEEPQYINTCLYGNVYVHSDNVALEVTADPLIHDGDLSPNLIINYLYEVEKTLRYWLAENYRNYQLSY